MISSQMRDQVLKYASLSIILAGVGLRLNQFAANRSLWLDEAMLAMNIVKRPFLDLLGPLDYVQAAPPGFLLVQKLMVTFLGSEDYVLRLFPLLAALGSLYLMSLISRQCLGRATGLVALGLFSFSDKLVYFASENKQYSTDVLFSLLLLYAAMRCLRDDARAGDYRLLGFLGIVALFFSHPALFVLAGVSAGLLLNCIATGGRERRGRLGMMLLAWFACAVLLYFASLRTIAANADRLDYFRTAFMPWPPWRDPSWYGHIFLRAISYSEGTASATSLILSLFFTGLLIIGSFSLFLRGKTVAALFLIPLLALLAASSFQKYPVTVRHSLFLIPILYLLIAEAVRHIGIALSRIDPLLSRTCCALIIGSLFIHPAWQGIAGIQNPEMREHIKPVLAFVQKNKVQGEAIYVYYAAWPAFSFYAPKYGFTEGDILRGIESRLKPERYLQDIERVGGKSRVWLIITHTCTWCRVDEEKLLLDSLAKKGTLLNHFEAPGARAYLFDLSGK